MHIRPEVRTKDANRRLDFFQRQIRLSRVFLKSLLEIDSLEKRQDSTAYVRTFVNVRMIGYANNAFQLVKLYTNYLIIIILN